MKQSLWPLAIFAMLSTVGVLNVIVFWLAQTSPPVPADERPYEQSLRYDETLLKLKTPTRLGWQHQLELTRNSAILRLESIGREPVTGSKIILELERPDGRAPDLTRPLTEGRPGVYEATFDPLPAGLWWAILHFEHPEQAILRETRLIQ